MKNIASILLLLLFCCAAYGQDNSKAEHRSETVKIYFDLNSHVIDLDFQQNRSSLSYFSDFIKGLTADTLTTISKIEINSFASPEGGRHYNGKLTERRSNSIYEYLTDVVSVPDSLIDKNHSGTDWEGLQRLVEQSDMQYKHEVISILENVPEETWRRVNPTDKWLTMVDSRNKHLMELRYGRPYNYMFDNIYPQLRNGSLVTIYFTREPEPVVEPEPEEVEVVEPEVETPAPQPEPVVEAPAPIIKPLFAIKTNLLYDVASAMNVEIEVPIGERWSVAGEWGFPWWKNKNDWTMQLLTGHLTAKYWFGNRDDFDVMTGWYLGVNGGASKYDFQIFNDDGIQGEAFDFGLQGGYAHTINKIKSLRMEYSLGVGYLQSDYKEYVKTRGTEFGDIKVFNYPWETKRRTWLGPTSAKVSLVWLLNYKSKGE